MYTWSMQCHRILNLAHILQVKQRTLPKSISCGKTFLGPNTLRNLPEVHRWLLELGRELEERVAVDRAENGREPKLITIHAGGISRSGPMRRPTAEAMAEDALTLVGVSDSSFVASLLNVPTQSGHEALLRHLMNGA